MSPHCSLPLHPRSLSHRARPPIPLTPSTPPLSPILYLPPPSPSHPSSFWFELRMSVRGMSVDIPGVNTAQPRLTPLRVFRDNVAHSNRAIGLRTYPHGINPTVRGADVSALCSRSLAACAALTHVGLPSLSFLTRLPRLLHACTQACLSCDSLSVLVDSISLSDGLPAVQGSHDLTSLCVHPRAAHSLLHFDPPSRHCPLRVDVSPPFLLHSVPHLPSSGSSTPFHHPHTSRHPHLPVTGPRLSPCQGVRQGVVSVISGFLAYKHSDTG